MTALREIFLQLLSMSLTSSLVIAVICFLRFLLKRAPKKFSYWLWAAAAFRLICPFSFSAVFSIFSFSSAGTVHSAGPCHQDELPAGCLPCRRSGPAAHISWHGFRDSGSGSRFCCHTQPYMDAGRCADAGRSCVQLPENLPAGARCRNASPVRL